MIVINVYSNLYIYSLHFNVIFYSIFYKGSHAGKAKIVLISFFVIQSNLVNPDHSGVSRVCPDKVFRLSDYPEFPIKL